MRGVWLRAVVVPGLVGLAVLARIRVDVWASDRLLWADAVRQAPCLSRPHALLALAAKHDGDSITAEHEVQTTIQLSLDHTCR